jgi:hypothetical protein
MNLHQFKNTTTTRTKSLALIRCIDQQCKLRNYLFMAGIKRRSFDRKPLPLTLLTPNYIYYIAFIGFLYGIGCF